MTQTRANKRIALTLRILLILTFLACLAYALGMRTYGTPFSTQNGGITYGQCGIEIWGPDGAGHFCGDY